MPGLIARTISVNGRVISEAEIRAEVAGLRAFRESSGETLDLEERLGLREQAIQSLVERVLMFQEAHRLNLAPAPAEIEQLAATLVPRSDGTSGCRAGMEKSEIVEEAERRLIFDRLIAHWCRHVKPPRPVEVRNYYRAHQDEFWRPEAVHASHIVKNSEGSDPASNRMALEQIRERLLAGEDFATLARTHSDCPENGGNLGFFPRGVMVEEFDDVVFTAPLHQLTPVFKTRFGVHVAMVHARRAEGIASLNEVAPAIETDLHRVFQDREVGLRLEALHRKAKVEVTV